MTVQTITAQKARELLAEGAVLVDIREPDEYARERIPGARSLPLGKLSSSGLQTIGSGAVIFHCRGGARTSANASTLASCAGGSTYILEGGLDAWKRAGLPVVTDRKRPIEIMRQVQITAGSLVLAGVLLGAAVSPLFYILPGLIGAGLTFSGITGSCAMASALRMMPWNRAGQG